MSAPTPDQQRELDNVVEWISRIRIELLDIEETLSRAVGFRGMAATDSLLRAFNHAQSAAVHAAQIAVRR